MIEFIPGQNEKPATVVEVDDEIILPGGVSAATGSMVRGKFLILELAWVDEDWTRTRLAGPAPHEVGPPINLRPVASTTQRRDKALVLRACVCRGGQSHQNPASTLQA